MYKKVTISGGFHNRPEIRIRARMSDDGRLVLSAGQVDRIWRHMCTYQGCICGLRHGWIIDGADRQDLAEAMAQAAVGW
jgi:hypothetical protein